MMPSLRSDTTFLVLLVCLLFAALTVTSADLPGAPVRAALRQAQDIALDPRPLPTSTPTPTPGWWAYVSTATPTLPGLPALPAVSLGGGGSGDAGAGAEEGVEKERAEDRVRIPEKRGQASANLKSVT